MKVETELFLGPGWAEPLASTVTDAHVGNGELLEHADSSALAIALQHLIDDLPEEVALIDEGCTIIAVNRAWTEAMRLYGYTDVAPGDDYRRICEKNAAEGYEPAIRASAALEEVVAGARDFWHINFHGRGRWSNHEYELSFHRVTVGSRSFITIRRFEVTEIFELRRLKEDFTKSLIEGQAVERQRLGRELHDSTAQVLTALGLALGRLKRESRSTEWLDIVGELQELLAEAQREIRSVTYLAFPPALKKMSLVDTLRTLAEGFGKRTGIAVSFDVHGEVVRLSDFAEIALYRIVQEALSNVYRHAHAARAGVALWFNEAVTHLVISDDGVGISNDALADRGLPGVGLTGMRSRLVELGGRLSVRRLAPGTQIIASIPVNRN
jgi:signal transduction histidine kinase